MGKTRSSRLGSGPLIMLVLAAVGLAAVPVAPAGKDKAQAAPPRKVFLEEHRLVLAGPLESPPMVLCGTAAGPVVTVSGPAELAGLDLPAGRFVWRVALDAPLAGGPAVCASGILAFDKTGTVVIVSRAGRVAARIATGEELAAAAEEDGMVCVRTAAGRAMAFAVGSGGAGREIAPGRTFAAGPVVSDGRVVYGDISGLVSAFSPRGAAAWTFKAGAPVLDDMAADGGLLFFGTADRRLFALSASRGKLKWKTRLAGTAAGRMSISGKRLVLATSASVVYCLGRKTGGICWWRIIGSRVFQEPVVSEGLVFLSADLPSMDALDLTSGAVKVLASVAGINPGRCLAAAVGYFSGRLAVVLWGDCGRGPELVILKAAN